METSVSYTKYFSIVKLCFGIILLSAPCFLYSSTLTVGGSGYASIQSAAVDASPGDTIFVLEGTYPGGMHITNLQGTPENWIYIISESNTDVIIEGGNNSIQFSDAEYVHVEGFIIQGQRANGMNIDDAGSFESPTHHIRIRKCTFQNIAATGNNDLLKLSGLDSFWIQECKFINGSPGGSGLDMVGCHMGFIQDCYFENMGNNSIQAKGGTQHIRISRNTFVNGGLRNINLGGSTGLAFFRPQDAPFEAADLQVYSNIFIGGWAGLAYVGSTRVDVANNTFYYPENWVFRILQENVDENRFVSCGDNLFRNNIIVYGDVHRDLNIGPNTRPESFTISHNLWFKPDDPSFNGPSLPVTETNPLYQQDPLFKDASMQDFHLELDSPCIGMGTEIDDLNLDHDRKTFFFPPSIGAFEGSLINSTPELSMATLKSYPNPCSNWIALSQGRSGIIYDVMGNIMHIFQDTERINVASLKAGLYFIRTHQGEISRFTKI